VRVKYINDRIPVLNIEMFKKKTLTIINAYAQTSRQAQIGNEDAEGAQRRVHFEDERQR